jgi:hypothetical protein
MGNLYGEQATLEEKIENMRMLDFVYEQCRNLSKEAKFDKHKRCEVLEYADQAVHCCIYEQVPHRVLAWVARYTEHQKGRNKYSEDLYDRFLRLVDDNKELFDVMERSFEVRDGEVIKPYENIKQQYAEIVEGAENRLSNYEHQQ